MASGAATAVRAACSGAIERCRTLYRACSARFTGGDGAARRPYRVVGRRTANVPPALRAGTSQRDVPTTAILCFLAWLAFAQAALCQAVYTSPYTFTTLAGKSHVGTIGNKSPLHFKPKSVAVDATGNVYFADSHKDVICRITPSGDIAVIAGQLGAAGSADGTGTQARFHNPRGIAIDPAGIIYVADAGNNTIRRISPGGVVTTLAGIAGGFGSDDGTGCDARFNFPVSLAVDNSGNIYVADMFNCTIRKVTSNGVVTTIAGFAGIAGGVDGKGRSALFNFPISVAVDSQDNVYVADLLNNAIRKVTAAGVVTTFAGRMSYATGNADGIGEAARFFHPTGLAVDDSDNIYVGDTDNNTVRRIAPDGAVTTLAGLDGRFGFADGAGSAARFWHPSNLATDRLGNLYVTDLGNAAIRKGSAATSTNTAFTFNTRR